MSTQREQLLAEQKSAETTIHSGTKSLPNPIKIHRTETNSMGDIVETHDFVSYDPSTDLFKVYCKSRSIEFAGKDFDWIFKALLSIGTEIPTQVVSFYDGDLVTPVEVFCGEYLKVEQIPIVERPETFEGWFYDQEFTQPFSLANRIKENTSVFAKRTEENI
jgi:hypothetical protein